MPRYISTATQVPYIAATLSEAVLIATNQLGEQSGGAATLKSCAHDDDGRSSACAATVTTLTKGFDAGLEVMKPTSETRHFVVKTA